MVPWHGQGLDDYEDDIAIAEYRSCDEKMDWSVFSVVDLNRCQSSLSFSGPEGMQFRLPAFLLADLEGTFAGVLLFHLTYLNDFGMSRFAAQSDAQREAVRESPLLLRDGSGSATGHGLIESALARF